MTATTTTGSQLGNGRYVVRGLLGEGAQGMTFDATDSRDGRAVAIKRFDVRGARSWKDVELAERETRVLASIDHPLVPRYIEHFEEDGALFLVMEKVEGETLDALRRRVGPLPEEEVRRFLSFADRALTYLHGRAQPVVHRDVKPRNVVRRPDGSYVLVDFGAVSEFVYRRPGGSTIVGTAGYMAPEQMQGRALPATDVYAVGATAIASLTGVEPEDLPHNGLRIDVRRALEGRASPALVSALERMLEPDPSLRPTSLAAALDSLNTASAPPPALRVVEAAPLLAPANSAQEDALVKSIRGLLWTLWGLSWVIVPVALRPFHSQQLIPIIMFGTLGVLLVLTWHKGALLRAAIRAMTGKAAPSAAPAASEPRYRIDAPTKQVRVQMSEVPSDELGRTERQSETQRRRSERPPPR